MTFESFNNLFYKFNHGEFLSKLIISFYIRMIYKKLLTKLKTNYVVSWKKEKLKLLLFMGS